ncbi:MAG: HAMP domain-containing histidine kinase [Bryobacterales bacterium]|nr:HAMP domain-containing histidine kinase [Bryobacterales bacterium]
MSPALPETAPLIALPWIVRLRYGLALAVALSLPAVQFLLGVDLPWRPMLVFPALIAASNSLLLRRVHGHSATDRISNSNLVALAFVLDFGCLTGLLALSGGPSNPFSLLYLVHITLAASILTKHWTWFLGFLATLCFGLLFFASRPIPALDAHHMGSGPNFHLVGMWVAFAVASFLVALFSGKISELIRHHEESLLRMHEELSRKDRLASLVTLAAGAAHELGTPLGTIAIVSKDLELYATEHMPDRSFAEDCRLIRTEVDRCQAILVNMSAQGATPVGEASHWTTPAELLAGVRHDLVAGGRVQIALDPSAAESPLLLPPHAIRQAIAALVKNGLEATTKEAKVVVTARLEEAHVLIDVTDRGAGMTDDQLRRIGEPFFTTKPPGMGMGLGVFLVRTLAEQVGAELTYRSGPATGTVATLRLPLAHRESATHA